MNNKNKLNRILERVETPARYIGMEHNSIKKDFKKSKVSFAFCFPDIYEVGMSYLGLHILYNLINEEDNYLCERVFSPGVDMEEEMRKENLPLLSLENKEEVRNFDILGFTLQHEMSFTNILNILDLAKIPFYSRDRDDRHPLIIAGGPGAFNPEPLADFIDFFIIGEGEELNLKILKIYERHKEKGFNKKDYLREVAKLDGIYVPSFYEVKYNKDGTIKSMTPIVKEAKKVIKRVYIDDLDKMYSPEKMIVPFIKTVHDRVILEIFRGCTHGCRFCQAGIIYRPIREKSPEKLEELAKKLVKNTGYEEVSLSSLSSCDYSNLDFLAENIVKNFDEEKISISLPSLRLDSDLITMLKDMNIMRRTGLTFAPEAGSQRLRNVINKGVTEEDFKDTLSRAYEEGWSKIKLYYMIGLPTEREEDLLGIRDMAYLARGLFFDRPEEEKKGNFSLNISAACFVPKAFTPFQWCSQDSREEFREKAYLINDSINDRKIVFSYHEPENSYIEAIFARGDRRLSKLLVKAYELGCKYDGWSEFFDFDKWEKALEETKIDGDFYARRKRELDEILPWDFIDTGVSKDYLIREYKKALNEETTDDCRKRCNACGIKACSMRGKYH